MMQTVLAGVLVFVVGQAIQRFLLEPIQEQRRVIGDIASAILLYGNIGPLPPDVPPESLALAATPAEATIALRTLAARLRATIWTIPLYGAWSGARVVHSRATILDASQQLVGWSNSLHSGQPGIPRGNVARLLGLPAD
jgi:hypothetical protein